MKTKLFILVILIVCFSCSTNDKPLSDAQKVPILIVHVGKDFVPNTDESLTLFLNKAVSQKVPFTLIHYAAGIHGFDVYADNEEIREIIKTTIEFWKFNLKQ